MAQHSPVEHGHRDICKFASSHEDDYKAVCTQVFVLVSGAPTATSRSSAVRLPFKAPLPLYSVCAARPYRCTHY